MLAPRRRRLVETCVIVTIHLQETMRRNQTFRTLTYILSLGASSYFLQLPYFCLICLCYQKLVFLKQTLKSVNLDTA